MAVPFRAGMDGKMLGTGMQLVIFFIAVEALQALYYVYSHNTCQIWVFSISFNSSSPSGIAIDVNGRRPHGQSLITFVASFRGWFCVFGTCFVGYGDKNMLQCIRIERGSHADGLREDGRVSAACDSVESFVPPVVAFDIQSVDGCGVVHHQRYFFFQGQLL